MLVFPQWRPEFPASGCSVPRWMPAKHFAPYLARPVALPPNLGYQVDDDESSGGSSPERERTDEDAFCGWRGCGLRFVNVARLSTHVARCHAAHAHRDGLFYCGWQGCTRPQRGFNARYKMLVHIRTHTNERPHTCSQCNKSFSRAENLKIHLRSHSGEKPYVCPYEGCGKAYSNSSDRFKHTRTHTVDKPYCCKVPGCNKRYTDPSSLRKHVKTYKHFAVEDQKKDSSDEVRETSPLRENSTTFSTIESTSPHQVQYSPKSNVSPIPPYNPILPEVPPLPYGHVYMRHIDPVYSIRVPSHEMSHLEYTQMYEHAYRNYYSNYPVLRPTVSEKVFTYEEPMIQDVVMKPIERSSSPIYKLVEEDMPLNLICAKRPIEELVRRTDLPLDLSTKS